MSFSQCRRIAWTAFLIWPLTTIAQDYPARPSSTDLLKQLVEISSGTRQVEAVNRVQKIISERLRHLGFQTEMLPNPQETERSGLLLVGTRLGKSKGFVTFIVHADTVFEPQSNFIHWSESQDHKSMGGPGVIDDKGGIVVALTGLESYLTVHPDSTLSFRVISSPSEETGSEGFLAQFKEYAKESKVVLGFEPALDDGGIVGARRGNRWYDIRVTGREAHAGRAHKDGVNACQALSIKLAALSKLTDYSKDVTVSIGHFEGGQDKFNIVCGLAEAKVDTRFSDIATRDLLHRKIVEILEKNEVKAASDGKMAELKYELANDCPPFSESKISKSYLDDYAGIISRLEGRPILAEKSGGAADSNYFNTGEGAVIDGLGPVGGKMHTAGEWVLLPSIEVRSKALTQFLEKLENRRFF